MSRSKKTPVSVAGESSPNESPAAPAHAAALYQDAVAAAHQLQRRHREYYSADPRGFRSSVRRAVSRVLRHKPGPKPDPRIAAAAKGRAGGTGWPELFAKYIDHYTELPPDSNLRHDAECGFRRKVNACRQRHRKSRRKLRKRD